MILVTVLVFTIPPMSSFVVIARVVVSIVPVITMKMIIAIITLLLMTMGMTRPGIRSDM